MDREKNGNNKAREKVVTESGRIRTYLLEAIKLRMEPREWVITQSQEGEFKLM
jgi:hypothetical protein